MRKLITVAAGIALAGSLSACGKSGVDRARPDEFAVARAAPLVIPPDFALVPPQPGAAGNVGSADAGRQALEAMFGPPSPRSAAETGTLMAAGRAGASPGIRSEVGDPNTNVIDKGATTRDIVAAPEGDGQNARASIPGG